MTSRIRQMENLLEEILGLSQMDSPKNHVLTTSKSLHLYADTQLHDL